jgi:hypothetical protein
MKAITILQPYEADCLGGHGRGNERKKSGTFIVT